MTRDEMIAKLMWNQGGMGYGVCTTGMMAIQNSMRPQSKEDDWISIVAVSGPPEKYTDEELEKLVAFSEAQTARYDKIFNYRMGCNLICINKVDSGSWMRKRQSWEYGSMFSETLDDAIAVFTRN